MVEILGKLFGSLPKVKIMRLFLLNPEQGFEVKDVAMRSRIPQATARREILALSAIDLVKKKTISKEIEIGRGKVKKTKIKRVPGWVLNPNFHYITQVKNLLIDAEFLKKEDIIARFKPLGKVKLLIISGIFLRDDESRVDFLMVGDNFKKSQLEQTIKTMEAEIGKELAYAVFSTKEFTYRLNMYDKLVRDILDFPHERIIDNGQFVGILSDKKRQSA